MILNNLRIHGYTFEGDESTLLGQSVVPAVSLAFTNWFLCL